MGTAKFKAAVPDSGSPVLFPASRFQTPNPSAPPAGEKPAADRLGWAHAVQLQPASGFMAEAVASFLAEGLTAGESAVAITTPERWVAICQACATLAVEVASHLRAGTLLRIDPEEALDAFLRDGQPVPALFESTFTSRLGPLCAGGRRLRVYGDTVDLLWRRGRPDAAIAVEDLWNRLLARLPMRILCGYSVESFDADSEGARFREVCGRHDRVQPVGGFDHLPVHDPSRLVAELQISERQAREAARRHLEAERSVERTRSELEVAHGRLWRLQRVTAALSEAVTVEDVARVVLTDIPPVVGASSVLLAVPAEAETLRIAAQEGMAPAYRARFASFPMDSELPVAEAWRTRRTLWIESLEELRARYPPLDASTTPEATACLPLEATGHLLGVLAFGFAEARRFDPADRALYEDLARQVACALDRARLYETARSSEARLFEAGRRKDEFLALLGHELRNPLAPIVTALELFKLKHDGGERPLELDVIERQVIHLTRLVDDLLDVSRITEGKLELKCEPADLALVLARALELVRPAIEQRGHRLELESPPAPVRIRADAVRLAQAVGNLLGNAAKYTPSGGTIALRSRREGDDAVIEVADSGAGIARGMLETIFEPFVQVDRTMESAQGGLGLGLALVRSVVELHGGSVVAESDGPGQGSVFRLRIPALTAAAEAAHAAADADVESELSSGSRRVLIVDDNRDAANSLGAMLRLLGHETDVAYSGSDAVALASTANFDVALLDIDLPDMDGYECARRLRALRSGEPGRFVAITGFGTAEDRRRSLAAGFTEHLVKPIDHARLLSLICS